MGFIIGIFALKKKKTDVTLLTSTGSKNDVALILSDIREICELIFFWYRALRTMK